MQRKRWGGEGSGGLEKCCGNNWGAKSSEVNWMNGHHLKEPQTKDKAFGNNWGVKGSVVTWSDQMKSLFQRAPNSMDRKAALY